MKCSTSTTVFSRGLIIIICSTILSLPIENCLSYLVYVTLRLTKYPASKGAQWLLWLKRSIRVVRALEVSTQIFLHIYVTVHLQFLRMLSDSKRARMKKKTERRENRSTNTVMQGCGKIFKKNNGLRMNQAWIANRVKQKKNEQTKQLPRKLEITFASFYSSNFFSGGVWTIHLRKKRVQTPLKKIPYIILVKITTTFDLN